MEKLIKVLKKLKVLALIPARGKSKSIKKKKNLLTIKNKSLIQRINLSLKKSKYIDKIICSTEDSQIINHCKRNKIEFIKRPEKLSADTSFVLLTAFDDNNFLKNKKN